MVEYIEQTNEPFRLDFTPRKRMKGFIKVHDKFTEFIINISNIQRVFEYRYLCFNSCIICDGDRIHVIETVQQIEDMIIDASTTFDISGFYYKMCDKYVKEIENGFAD